MEFCESTEHGVRVAIRNTAIAGCQSTISFYGWLQRRPCARNTRMFWRNSVLTAGSAHVPFYPTAVLDSVATVVSGSGANFPYPYHAFRKIWNHAFKQSNRLRTSCPTV